MNISSYVAEFYIDSKTLDWATTEGCPSIFNEYAQTFSEEKLLNALKGKIVDYELKVRKE